MLAALVVAALFTPLPARAAHDTVRIALLSEPTSLNPLYLSGSNFVMVSELLFEPLLAIGPGGSFIPALARAEPTTRNGGISPDGLHITFHLRTGTLWSDGSPVTAADFAFAIEAALNPKNTIPDPASNAHLSGARAPNAATLIVDLRQRDPLVLSSLMNLTPLPHRLLAAYPDLNQVPYNALPVGNGPFVVQQWRHGDVIRLVANARYWRGPPAITNLELRIIPSDATQILSLRTHEVDLIRVLSAAQVPSLPTDGVTRTSAQSFAWVQLTFNLARPALADLRVRRALTMAVDRDAIVRDAGHGLYHTDRLMLPMFQWALDPAIHVPRFDRTAANALLDAAGWTVGADGVRHKNGETLRFTMVYVAGGDGVVPTMVAADLAAVHVAIDQKPIEYARLYDIPQAGGVLLTGKFDLALLNLQTGDDPDMSWLFACVYRAPAGFNFAGYCNPKVDAAFAHSAASDDPAVRTAALATVQRTLIDDAAFDPLYRIDDTWVSADWLDGIHGSPYDVFWNAYAWKAKP
jgi:peptide/nickel transport system substrate-binding protein